MAGMNTLSLALRRWLCVAHLALIAVLSLVPAWLFPPSAASIPGIDKAVHVAMYGGLGALLRWAAGVRPNWAAHLGLPLAAAGYGLLMESLQLWVGSVGRGFSWGDAGANLGGAFLFWWGTNAWMRCAEGRKEVASSFQRLGGYQDRTLPK